MVTVNDYLARRDADWMGPIYDALGITVGVIGSMMPEAERRESYAADVTYGTNAEFGFDYLRDNMAVRLEDCVQRGHYFCIVDEVDSILIDEARTPLIISGVPEAAADTYYRFARIVPTLKAGDDFEVDEKHRTASPTESGVDKVEKALGIENLYLDVNGNLVNHLIQALKAHSLYRKDKEYIVREGELMIVDEFTGRVLEGRRYSEGLHQALEAKEGLRIREENQTLATITLQNYFRMYEKLSGMTGTASPRPNEFAKIYKAEVVSIPTHRAMVRIDQNDSSSRPRTPSTAPSSRTSPRRTSAASRCWWARSRWRSPRCSRGCSTGAACEHNVLNAKNTPARPRSSARRPAARLGHDRHQHGRARRDIKLGEGVEELGGLYIVGTERHESRRIDNQLRGRVGTPGRPGPLALLPVGRGRPDPHLRRRPHLQDPRPRSGRATTCRSRRRCSPRPSRAPRRRSRSRTSTSASGARVRRRAEQAARGVLLERRAGARGRGPRRAGARLDRRALVGSSTSTTRSRCRPTGTSTGCSGRSRLSTP